MQTAPMRAFLGFVAAAISVLTFHQGMWAVLFYALSWGAQSPYPTNAIGPLGVPLIVDLCFWGGLYGAVFGLLRPRFTLPLWLCGLIMGIIAALVGMFIVAPIKGNPIANGWMIWPILRSLLINGAWGLGVGLILPLLLPRGASRRGAGLQTSRR
jgi:tetrahydromethanopterin S-methyltransferase subunit C